MIAAATQPRVSFKYHRFKYETQYIALVTYCNIENIEKY